MKHILFDSSVWIELFKDKNYVKKLGNFKKTVLVLSPINLYEVYRKCIQIRPTHADFFVDEMRALSKTIDVNSDIALRAVLLRAKYSFSMADAIILSTAIEAKAKLITKDKDFKDVDEIGVEIL